MFLGFCFYLHFTLFMTIKPAYHCHKNDFKTFKTKKQNQQVFGVVICNSFKIFDIRSRKWTISSPKETSTAGHGWNLYVVDTVHPFTLYQEMVTLAYKSETSLKREFSIYQPMYKLSLCSRLNTAVGTCRPPHNPTVFVTSSVKRTSSCAPLCFKHQSRSRAVTATHQCPRKHVQAVRLMKTQLHRRADKNWRRRSGRTALSWETVSAGTSPTRPEQYLFTWKFKCKHLATF